MKILHLSTYDTATGAAFAAYRLHQGLQRININSQMLVRTKKLVDDKTVVAPQTILEKGFAKAAGTLDTLPPRFYPQRDRTSFSTQWFPDRTIPRVARINPDLLNFHWIADNHLHIETIPKLHQPLVWTLHDMWAFTGGCHYDQNCGRYIDSCGACPQLKSNKNFDLSCWIWQRKYKAWKGVSLTIVAPSRWLAKCASSSSLFKHLRVEVIPNALDTQKYKPINRQIVRKILNLPQNKQLILFGAMNAASDVRKGFHLLQPALQRLCQSGRGDRVEIIIVGSSQPENHIDLGFKTHYLGKLSGDTSLAQVYAAADVFVAPSLQDNLPNTVMEAIACGTPCVAFKIGGMPDMIEHQKNGYLVQPFEVEDLAKGIAWVLEDRERHQKLGDRAREKAEQEFTLELQARRYASLYTEILAKRDR
jgi:glycosyltransferase involved in cell wall biosynthesis